MNKLSGTGKNHNVQGNNAVLSDLMNMQDVLFFNANDASDVIKQHEKAQDIHYLMEIAPYTRSINLGSETAMRLHLLADGKVATKGEQYKLYTKDCDEYLKVADTLLKAVHEILDGNPGEDISYVPAVFTQLMSVPKVIEYIDEYGSSAVNTLLDEVDITLALPGVKPVERIISAVLRVKLFHPEEEHEYLLEELYEGCCTIIDTAVSKLLDSLNDDLHSLLADQCASRLSDREVMTKMFNMSNFNKLLDQHIDDDCASVEEMLQLLMDERAEWLEDRIVIDPLTLNRVVKVKRSTPITRLDSNLDVTEAG